MVVPPLISCRFGHAPWDSIKKQNVLIWLAWTCFNIPYEEAIATPKWSNFLQESLELLEARTGTRFPSGSNPDVEVMRLTLDPVNVGLESQPLDVPLCLLGQRTTSSHLCTLECDQLVAPGGGVPLPGYGLRKPISP